MKQLIISILLLSSISFALPVLGAEPNNEKTLAELYRDLDQCLEELDIEDSHIALSIVRELIPLEELLLPIEEEKQKIMGLILQCSSASHYP